MEDKKKTKVFTKELIIALVVGLIIGAAIMYGVSYFLNNNTIIKVGGKTIRKNELFTTMKEYFSVGLIVDEIDNIILPQKYKLTEDMEEDINKQADYWINMYKSSYGYTEEEFLDSNGFKNKDEFLEYLRLDYRRNLYYYDYLENKLESGAVQKYYEENKADVEKAENEHILVQVTDGVTDEQALALAKEIIQKLNEGTSFKNVAEEYAEKVKYEELGFVGKKDSIAEPYLTALFSLEDGKYTAEPIKTEFGYHVIHRTGTSSFEDVRKDIIDILANDIISSDTNIASKALLELRKEYKLNIKDKTLKAKYEEYEKDLNKTEE